MSVQPARTKFETDFEKYMNGTSATREMLRIQTAALSEICALEPSFAGGVTAREIARQALCEPVKVAPKTEVQNA